VVYVRKGGKRSVQGKRGGGLTGWICGLHVLGVVYVAKDADDGQADHEVSGSVMAKWKENAHKPRPKHGRRTQLLPQAQFEFRYLIDRQADHNDIQHDIHEAVGIDCIGQVNAFCVIFGSPALPCRIYRSALEHVGEHKRKAHDGVENDDNVGISPKRSRGKDAQEEEAYGDFGEGHFDFVDDGAVVECLSS
jgi:hypothetical protein